MLLAECACRYAATDAFATLLVFEELQRKLKPLLAASKAHQDVAGCVC